MRSTWGRSVRWTPSFNRANAGADSAALDYASVEAALPVELGAGLSVRPHAGISIILPASLRRTLDQTAAVDVGVTVGGVWAL